MFGARTQLRYVVRRYTKCRGMGPIGCSMVAFFPTRYGRMHKACQLKPNSAGLRMCAVCATISYTSMAKLCQLLLAHSKRCCIHLYHILQHFVPCIQCKGRASHSPCKSQRRGCGLCELCSNLKPGQRTAKFSALWLNDLAMLPNHIGNLSIEIVLNQKSPNCTLLRSRKGDALTLST